jgi:hypothetical protein
MTELTAERRTCVRTRGMSELRDRLKAARRRRDGVPIVLKCSSNAWDMGKGDGETDSGTEWGAQCATSLTGRGCFLESGMH